MPLPTKRSVGFAVSAQTAAANYAPVAAMVTSGAWPIVYLHPQAWDEPTNGNLVFPVAVTAGAKAIDIALVLDPWTLDSNRTELRLPPGFGGGANPPFSNAEWRAAYTALCVGMVTAIQAQAPGRLKYFCPFPEANLFFAHDPTDYANLLTLFTAIRTAVRAVVSGLKVYLTYVYEDLSGRDGGGGQAALFGASACSDQDVIGITTYPQFIGGTDHDPITLPDNYLSYVGGRGKPVVIDEAGWATTAVGTPGASFPSTQQHQADYLRRLARISARLDELEWVNYTALPDFNLGELALPELENLGLLSNVLAQKLAFAVFCNLDDVTPMVRDYGRDLPNTWVATPGATATWEQTGIAVDPGGGCWVDYVPGDITRRLPLGSGATSLTSGQHYVAGGKIHVRTPDDSHPGTRISVAARQFGLPIFEAGAQYSRIEIRRCGTAAVQIAADGVELTNCTFRDCQIGMIMQGSAPSVRNCAVDAWGFCWVLNPLGPGSDPKGGECDFNRYRAGVLFGLDLDGFAPISMGDWQTATSGEASSTEGDPAIQRTGMPRRGSACLRGGTQVTGVNDEYSGPAPDIGAFALNADHDPKVAAACAAAMG